MNYRHNPQQLSSIYETMNSSFIDGKEVFHFKLDKLQENKIMIRKDSRFTFVPFFVHSNVNINYIYSGACTYCIEGKYITLQKGDVCIFDKNVVRSKLKTGFDDIVINISLSNDFFNSGFINRINKQSIIAKFIIDALSSNNAHDNYLVFDSGQSNLIRQLFDSLLEEYYDQGPYAKEVIDSYIAIIFMKLLELYQDNPESHIVKTSTGQNDNFIKILSDIEIQYATISLNELAAKYGYNPKYLSGLIKEKVGKSFKELQTDKRLAMSCFYLENTDLPVNEVAIKVGFSNLNHFYKKFNDRYQATPFQYRHQK